MTDENGPGRGPDDTRMIALGGAALTQGFALVGFETWPDADADTLGVVLDQLLTNGQRALVLLEPDLACCDCAQLARVRAESDRIVIAEIPPLQAPQEHRPAVEDLVLRVMGAHALDESHER